MPLSIKGDLLYQNIMLISFNACTVHTTTCKQLMGIKSNIAGVVHGVCLTHDSPIINSLTWNDAWRIMNDIIQNLQFIIPNIQNSFNVNLFRRISRNLRHEWNTLSKHFFFSLIPLLWLTDAILISNLQYSARKLLIWCNLHIRHTVFEYQTILLAGLV